MAENTYYCFKCGNTFKHDEIVDGKCPDKECRSTNIMKTYNASDSGVINTSPDLY